MPRVRDFDALEQPVLERRRKPAGEGGPPPPLPTVAARAATLAYLAAERANSILSILPTARDKATIAAAHPATPPTR